ncbi:medium-chain acyl-CoA ligase ACSF2, mitochondrial-like isoform X2 [Bradysia coprophila]|uniref:medium-chain acyl-CoA ligase ACSF2, mitochondrial-like isoform X2 n=1 Tax=Bradysia coprophila TaxID=38358 RepID=UPI00187DA1AB|nr:medium-chain acyl-CoA ligase ACSF2, mitochondrial-like isoform X2 [Bradysia coprophila]
MIKRFGFPILKRHSNALFSYRKCYSTVSTNPEKLSYYHHIGNDPLVYRTYAEHFEISAKKYGNREAIVSCHEGKRYTYTEALEKVNQLASGFINIGLNKGDRIGIWSPNSAQWYITMLAAAKAGLISVALNPAYQGPEIAQCIKKVNMRAIVAPESYKAQNYYEMICKNVPEVTESRGGVIKSSEFDSFTTLILDSPNRLKGTRTFEDVLQLGADKNCFVKVKPDEPCNIQFTSGTTGTPKAALLSHYNFVNNGIHVGNRSQYSEKPHRICVLVPFFHVFGIVVSMTAAITHGATIVVPAPTFNAEKSLRAIVDEQCTVIHGTPTMYVDLIAKQKELNLPISTTEIAVTGGSPCPPQLFRNIKSTFNLSCVKTVYGLTELSACVFFSLNNETEKQVTETVGSLQDHLEAKIVDQEGDIVPFGKPGELCVRGYSTMLGYFNDEAKTKEIFTRDKWLKTGDQFILQEDGYGRIVGRFKEMIIRGGENIFPKEIEDFLSTHPDIIEAQVVGVPDDRMGEEICAFIRTTEKGKVLQQNDIKEFCTGSIAHFKIPRYMKVVDEFPRTTSGKIQKFKLKEQYEKEKCE